MPAYSPICPFPELTQVYPQQVYAHMAASPFPVQRPNACQSSFLDQLVCKLCVQGHEAFIPGPMILPVQRQPRSLLAV